MAAIPASRYTTTDRDQSRFESSRSGYLSEGEIDDGKGGPIPVIQTFLYPKTFSRDLQNQIINLVDRFKRSIEPMAVSTISTDQLLLAATIVIWAREHNEYLGDKRPDLAELVNRMILLDLGDSELSVQNAKQRFTGFDVKLPSDRSPITRDGIEDDKDVLKGVSDGKQIEAFLQLTGKLRPAVTRICNNIVTKKIGSGSYGNVYSGIDFISGQPVAIKTQRTKGNRSAWQNFLREASIESLLRRGTAPPLTPRFSPGSPQGTMLPYPRDAATFHGSLEEVKGAKGAQPPGGAAPLYYNDCDDRRGESVTVMPLADMDLDQLLTLPEFIITLESSMTLGDQNTRALRTILLKIASDLVCDLAHIHAKRIIHNDIKPHNILIFFKRGAVQMLPPPSPRPSGTTSPTSTGTAIGTAGGGLDTTGGVQPPYPSVEVRARIGDFGLAEFVDGKRRPDGRSVGTKRYNSPEKLCGIRDYGQAADVWALGLVLADLLMGVNPFDVESKGYGGLIASMFSSLNAEAHRDSDGDEHSVLDAYNLEERNRMLANLKRLQADLRNRDKYNVKHSSYCSAAALRFAKQLQDSIDKREAKGAVPGTYSSGGTRQEWMYSEFDQGLARYLKHRFYGTTLYDQLWDMIRGMTELNPELRWTMDRVVSSAPFSLTESIAPPLTSTAPFMPSPSCASEIKRIETPFTTEQVIDQLTATIGDQKIPGLSETQKRTLIGRMVRDLFLMDTVTTQSGKSRGTAFNRGSTSAEDDIAHLVNYNLMQGAAAPLPPEGVAPPLPPLWPAPPSSSSATASSSSSSIAGVARPSFKRARYVEK